MISRKEALERIKRWTGPYSTEIIKPDNAKPFTQTKLFYQKTNKVVEYMENTATIINEVEADKFIYPLKEDETN